MHLWTPPDLSLLRSVYPTAVQVSLTVSTPSWSESSILFCADTLVRHWQSCSITFLWIGQILYPSFIAEMKRPQDFPKALATLTIAELILFTVTAAVGYYYCGQYSTAPIIGSLSEPWARKSAFALVLVPTVIIGSLYANIAAKFVFKRVLGKTTHMHSHSIIGWSTWIGIDILIWGIGFILGKWVVADICTSCYYSCWLCLLVVSFQVWVLSLASCLPRLILSLASSSGQSRFGISTRVVFLPMPRWQHSLLLTSSSSSLDCLYSVLDCTLVFRKSSTNSTSFGNALWEELKLTVVSVLRPFDHLSLVLQMLKCLVSFLFHRFSAPPACFIISIFAVFFWTKYNNSYMVVFFWECIDFGVGLAYDSSVTSR